LDPQHGPVIAGVDQIHHGLFLGQDHVEGEAFMAFALVRLARRSQPNADLIDGGLHHQPRRPFGVNR
jgi:hypothetical protein